MTTTLFDRPDQQAAINIGWVPYPYCEDLYLTPREYGALSLIFGPFSDEDLLVFTWHRVSLFLLHERTGRVAVSHMIGNTFGGQELWSPWESSSHPVVPLREELH